MVLTSRRLRVRVPLALFLTLIAGLTQASAASATCSSSTPSSIALGDSPTDAQGGLAPEIKIVMPAVDAACNYSVDPGITEPLKAGDSVFVYVNVDGDKATGSQEIAGADAIVGSLGADGPDPAPRLGRWDPATNSFSFAGAPSVTPRHIGGFSASLDQLGVVKSPTVTTVEVATSWVDGDTTYSDVSPEAVFEPLPLIVTFSTAAPPQQPLPLPVAPVPPAPVAPPLAPPVATPPPVTPTPKACTVPSLKRLRTAAAKSALRRAGCKVGLTRRAYNATVRSGRVIFSSPKAGAAWAKPVDLLVSRGRKPQKRQKAHRATAADVRNLLEIAARQR